MAHWSKWYRTNDRRIVPWFFGLMRAEFIWRRDWIDNDGEVMSYQLRPRSAGRLPDDMDGPGAFGFWSLLAAKWPANKAQALWRPFVFFFGAPSDDKPGS
jgi:hypothetical protein